MEYIPYTYILIHNPTGLKYYGSSYANSEQKVANPSQFWKNYFTSSKEVKTLIKEYGKDSFEFEIRKTFKDRKSCIKWEVLVIDRLDIVKREDFLNKANPSKGKWNIIESNPWKGKTGRYSEEHRNNLAYKSSNAYKDINVRKNHSKKISGSGNPAFSKIWINNGKVEKRVLERELDYFIVEGFTRGKLKRIYINDGKRDKLIFPRELEYYISLGFVLGYKSRNRDNETGKFIKL